jgi:hypothetical protein
MGRLQGLSGGSMVIATNDAHLLEEIRASEGRRDEKLASLPDRLERFHGPWYNGGGPEQSETVDPENHAYEFTSAFLPQVLNGHPRIKASTSRPTAQKFVAQAIQTGTNRWTRDTGFKATLEEFAYDYLFAWAFGLVSVGPRKDAYHLKDPLLLPQVQRVSPNDGGWDAMASNPSRARIFFHRWSIDKDDLVALAEADKELPEDERQGWNIEGVKALVGGEPIQMQHVDGRHTVDRNKVWLYDVWVADDQVDEDKGPDQGFHGTVRTVSEVAPKIQNGNAAIRVKDPQDYYGPPSGPYVVGGCYLVPDKNEPLSPLVATEQQSNALNSFANQTIEDALSYVKKTFLSGEDPIEADRINNAKHQHVTLLENVTDLQNRLISVEMGGVTDQHFAVLGYLRELLERVSGFNDVQKGNITGDGTATEVGFAVEASAGRAEFVRGKFIAFAEECLRRVAYFLYHTDQVVFPLGEEGLAAAQSGMTEPLPEAAEAWFFGGTFDEGSGGTFDDLELEIELYSMARTSEASIRRKAEVLTGVVLNVYPLLTAPGIRAHALIELIADLENMPEILNIFDFEEIGKAGTGVAHPMLSRQAGTATQGTNLPAPAPTDSGRSSGAGTLGQDLASAFGQSAPQTNGSSAFQLN